MSERRPPLPLLIDAPRCAVANMARDEALLDGERTLIRRTAWRDPAVTIGRFQPWTIWPAETDGGPRGVARAPIRRITGGGGIEHGGDLTLAWVAPCPSDLFPDRSPCAIANRAAEALRTALEPFFPDAHLRGGDFDERQQATIPRCFARETPFDLVVGSGEGATKVGGLAVHRRKNRVLIQVSIDRRETLAADQDREFLLGLAAALDAPPEEIDDLTPEEEMRSVELAIRRYGLHEWNRRIWEPGQSVSEAPIGAEESPEPSI